MEELRHTRQDLLGPGGVNAAYTARQHSLYLVSGDGSDGNLSVVTTINSSMQGGCIR